jgi:hypothetical protein
MGTARRIGVAGILLGLAMGTLTLLALEGGEVVIVRTRDTNGGVRETRTWIADRAGESWIEAASPMRPFFLDVLGTPDTELWRGGRWQHCRALVAANPEGHARVRSLLAQKYGWRDRWIGMLVDTSGSMALRLACGAP